jgi:hypothetical protein
MNATYQPQQHGKFQPEKILNVSKKRPECSEGRVIIKEMHTENKIYHFGTANNSFAASNDSLTRETM